VERRHRHQLVGLAGSTLSIAYAINNAGQIVGDSYVDGVSYATEWSGGSIINLGLGSASGINDLGQVVGSGPGGATEWSNSRVVNLGNLPGAVGSDASAINDTGQVVGTSDVSARSYATEWTGGSVINRGGQPAETYSFADGINNAGQVVGISNGSPSPNPRPGRWC
jgi:probable HAF family extracellular repeat protein